MEHAGASLMAPDPGLTRLPAPIPLRGQAAPARRPTWLFLLKLPAIPTPWGPVVSPAYQPTRGYALSVGQSAGLEGGRGGGGAEQAEEDGGGSRGKSTGQQCHLEEKVGVTSAPGHTCLAVLPEGAPRATPGHRTLAPYRPLAPQTPPSAHTPTWAGGPRGRALARPPVPGHASVTYHPGPELVARGAGFSSTNTRPSA